MITNRKLLIAIGDNYKRYAIGSRMVITRPPGYPLLPVVPVASINGCNIGLKL